MIELEQAYAPPFSSAKDPVNMVGFVAKIILPDRLKVIECEELGAVETDAVLVDVRTTREFAGGTIEWAINILLEIRNHLSEIPKDKPLYIFCQQGMRGYMAQRLLVQNGSDAVTNLSGGYLQWKALKKEMMLVDVEVCHNS